MFNSQTHFKEHIMLVRCSSLPVGKSFTPVSRLVWDSLAVGSWSMAAAEVEPILHFRPLP